MKKILSSVLVLFTVLSISSPAMASNLQQIVIKVINTPSGLSDPLQFQFVPNGFTTAAYDATSPAETIPGSILTQLNNTIGQVILIDAKTGQLYSCGKVRFQGRMTINASHPYSLNQQNWTCQVSVSG